MSTTPTPRRNPPATSTFFQSIIIAASSLLFGICCLGFVAGWALSFKNEELGGQVGGLATMFGFWVLGRYFNSIGNPG